DGESNVFSFVFLADGAQMTSTSTSPFMTLTDSYLDTAGSVLFLGRSTAGAPTRLTLAGPLLAASNSNISHTSLGFASTFFTAPTACCSAFFVGQGAQLTSTTGEALIQLNGSVVTGNAAQSGGPFFAIVDSFAGAPSAELVAPASVSLAGRLLEMNG